MSPARSNAADDVLLLQSELARSVTDMMAAQGADLPAVRRQSDIGNSWHLTYLAEALRRGDSTVFVQYAGWLEVHRSARGVAADHLLRTLAAVRDAVAERLPHLTTAVRQVVEDAVAALPSAMVEPSHLRPDAPHAELARTYLSLLRAARRNEACAMVLASARAGVSVRDLYKHVLQPCQRDVGRLWLLNEVTVAQEHYCTAATQFVMANLAPLRADPPAASRIAVAACVGGEEHEVGLRMVADAMELDGWGVYYLGANVPSEAVAEAVQERNAHLLALSATMPSHVSLVAEAVTVVRARVSAGSVKVMVGGAPFPTTPGLWRTVGTDGYAQDLDRAVELANDLIPAA